MRTLLIEDEKAALRNLKAAMKEMDTDFEIVGETDSVTGTIEWFKSHPMPELVFMDIHLADGSAFNIFSQTDITCPIIFTTAYDEYALQAFRVNSIAYLLKPISSDDLQRAMNKMKMLERHNPHENVNGLQQIIRTLCREETFKTHFLIPVKGDKFIPINVEDIMYFYIEDGTVKAATRTTGTVRFPQTLDEIATMLHPQKFFRANRQYIISRKAVVSISHWFGGRLSVQLEPQSKERVLISKARVTAFKDWF